MTSEGLAFARAASQPIVSGVCDLDIAAIQVISRNGKSPFNARVWAGARAGLKTAFLGALCFSRNRVTLGSRLGRRATGESIKKERQEN